MDMRAYQLDALKTDQVPRLARGTSADADSGLIVPLLGLAGETGELLTEYKKRLRDGAAHRMFKDRVSEELGDLLWYLANVASKFDLDLNAIAELNLKKVNDRWGQGRVALGGDFDTGYPETERLPRRFEMEFTEVRVEGRVKMRLLKDGQPVGNELTDNAYDPDDGYRFHDVFHCAYAAVLGWSPVIRKLQGRKRKSNATVDEVEDGARAAAIEEGLSAMVFEYARQHNFLDGVVAVDHNLLRTIKGVTSQLEVSRCGLGSWEKAVLQGFEVWRELKKHLGGRVLVDLDGRRISYEGAPAATTEP
jgi:NTP pyrophosphatase (non-canonical NTP hydrolase)